MPHVDGLVLQTPLRAPGESRFARPVAAITAFVVTILRSAAAAIARWQTRRQDEALLRRQGRKSWEIRRLEEHFSRAGDRHHLEQMEREWDRRDGGGMRGWDWR